MTNINAEQQTVLDELVAKRRDELAAQAAREAAEREAAERLAAREAEYEAAAAAASPGAWEARVAPMLDRLSRIMAEYADAAAAVVEAGQEHSSAVCNANMLGRALGRADLRDPTNMLVMRRIAQASEVHRGAWTANARIFRR